MQRVLYPNLGAEEDDAPPSSTPPSHLRILGAAWARALEVADGLDLVTAGLVAWLNTPRAKATAQARGLPLWGADPAVVDVVHDKAFCARVARDHGLVEPELRGAITILDANETTVDALVARTRAQPTWMQTGGLVAKPRRGTSGRGRLDLRRGLTERAVARLRRRGGVVVEPWLPRVADYSSQWWIDERGRPRFLGATLATQNFAGLWQGARMWIDDDGVPSIPGMAGREVVDRSHLVVREAARAGHLGPCGVDVFSWRNGDGALRWRLCEFNARMTGGLVAVLLAIELVRRGLARPGDRIRYADGAAVVDDGDRTVADDGGAVCSAEGASG
jgi:hypothetical protein